MGYMTEQQTRTSKKHMVTVAFEGLTGARNAEGHNPVKMNMDLG